MKVLQHILTGLTILLAASSAYGENLRLENNRYALVLDTDKTSFTLTEKESGCSAHFTPTFLVLYKSTGNAIAPAMTALPESNSANYYAVSWNGVHNLFNNQAGFIRLRSADSFQQTDDNRIAFEYSQSGEFTIASTLTLPEGDGEPVLQAEVTVLDAGCFSIGYYGAPSCPADEAADLWQPLIWTDRIFPQDCYLTPEYHCTLPATMVTREGVTYGVAADREESDFELLPTFNRSGFGVALRNRTGFAQPMVFAPIMGSARSKKKVSDQISFSYRLFVTAKSIPDTYADLSQRLFGFGEFPRNNRLGSLNETFENMVEYGMSPYSQFDSELKGSSYNTDVKNSVRNTSAMHALNIAFATEDETIFSERALPVIEYMLSRDQDLFALVPTSGAGGQNAGNTLGSPCIRSSEAAALFEMTNGTHPFLLQTAIDKQSKLSNSAHEKSWRDRLALYRASGKEEYLTQAAGGAQTYIGHRIDNKETEFSYTDHSRSPFWSAYAPKWIELYEMYETTGNGQFLQAAHEGARRFARYLWMSPAVPDRRITVNQGNKAPVYNNPSLTPMPIAEETVEAWSLSAAGLHTEASSTSLSHRAVFMAHHAPYMLRIASLTGDGYLREIARSAIIGRYLNFPGYHINTDRTTVYEKADFPLRNPEELTCTSMHYSHVWPMISLLLDYLVSDAYALSNGRIDFGSQFVEAFAYLQGRTYYGHGSFYGTDSIVLYMPKGLLSGGDPQLNHISARKGNSLYFAFCNQSDKAVDAVYTLSHDLAPVQNGNIARCFTNNETATGNASISGQQLSVHVPAQGITAIEVSGCTVKTSLQDAMLSNHTEWNIDRGYFTGLSGEAMILNFGKGHRYAYAYSSAPKGTYASLNLHYELEDGTTGTVSDPNYPFEFEIPLPDDCRQITLQLTDGTNLSSQVVLHQGVYTRAAIETNEQAVFAGDPVRIQTDLWGKAPWQLTFDIDGETYVTDPIAASPYVEDLNSERTDNFKIRLTGVSDAENATGDTSGEIRVFIANDSIRPSADTYIQENTPEKDYAKSKTLDLKTASGWTREIYLRFPLSAISGEHDKYMFRIYLSQIDKDLRPVIELSGNSDPLAEIPTWNDREQVAFEAIGEKTVSQASAGSYLTWDVTRFVEACRSEKQTYCIFRLRITGGGDALCRFASTESGKNEPALLFIESDAFPSSSITDATIACRIYPNPCNEYITICCGQQGRVRLTDLTGRVLVTTILDAGETILQTGHLPDGIYLLHLDSNGNPITRKIIKQSIIH